MKSGVRLRRAVAGDPSERVFKAEAFAFFPLPAPMPFPPALPLPVALAFDLGDGARVPATGLGEEGRRPLPLRSLLRRVLAATSSPSLPSSSLVLPELFASNWLRALFGGGASER